MSISDNLVIRITNIFYIYLLLDAPLSGGSDAAVIGGSDALREAKAVLKEQGLL